MSCWTVPWSDFLRQSRAFHAQHLENGGEDAEVTDFYARVRGHVPRTREILDHYLATLLQPNGANTKEETKKLIVSTRAALRLGLSCSAWPFDPEQRDAFVRDAVATSSWQTPLSQILCTHNKGDAKCTTLAAQLLSNLATSHHDAAMVISKQIPLAPASSEEATAATIRGSNAVFVVDDGDDNDCDIAPVTETTVAEPNWVDMILCCARSHNREALAGVVAALHNGVVSLKPNNHDVEFAQSIAANSLLISTLLRQLISSISLKNSIVQNNNNKEGHDRDDTEISLADSATEWICLLTWRLCRRGFFPSLYASAAGGTKDSCCETIGASAMLKIVPEHIVLLHCIRSEVDSGMDPTLQLLGGETDNKTKSVVTCYVFLANLFCSLRASLPTDTIALVDTPEDPDVALTCSALVTILEILATSLGVDDPSIAHVRTKLGGMECSFIRDCTNDLGMLLDTLSARNSGQKSREYVMHNEEQQVLTVLVRVLGNLCFRCRQNQDRMRLTAVPARVTPMISETGEATAIREERHALHVLLSCTSLSHSCFTLREWAVVAIRNVLDDNELNQQEVAKLEANQAVQSAELGAMGVRVDLDSKGKVSVVHTDQ